jgi:hypothetical protein
MYVYNVLYSSSVKESVVTLGRMHTLTYWEISRVECHENVEQIENILGVRNVLSQVHMLRWETPCLAQRNRLQLY